MRTETFVTGTGQSVRVHPRAKCDSTRPCVVHRPSDHLMASFPTNWREDKQVMERICPHGVGHPDPDDALVSDDAGVHGCDGCCHGGVKA
jgi:hypothetical protein